MASKNRRTIPVQPGSFYPSRLGISQETYLKVNWPLITRYRWISTEWFLPSIHDKWIVRWDNIDILDALLTQLVKLWEESWKMWFRTCSWERCWCTTTVNLGMWWVYMMRLFLVPISFWRSIRSVGPDSMRLWGGILELGLQFKSYVLLSYNKEGGAWSVEKGLLHWRRPGAGGC